MNILMIASETTELLDLGRDLERAPFGPHEVKHLGSLREGLAVLDRPGTEVLILELDSRSTAPLSPLEQIHAADPALPIVVLIDDPEASLSLDALRVGAGEVLGKDRLTGESLSRAARYALERSILDRELRDREDQYRRIVDTAEEGIWTIDSRDRTVFANRKMTELLGYSLNEMLGKTPLDFMDEESQALAIPRLAAKRKGEISRLDMRYRRKDGSALWTTIMTNPDFDDRGRYRGAMALVTDISDRMQKEAVLHRLAALVASSEDGIIAFDPDGTILHWNQAAERMYGYSAQEANGRSIRFIVPPDRQVEMDGVLVRARKGEPTPSYETVMTHKDGRPLTISVTISPIRDNGGKPVAASVIARDASSRHKLEEQLRQSQKMEAVGRLAGGVAHDFNNLLTVISGYTSLILTRNGGDVPYKEELEEIGRAGDRAASLTRQLLAFSRKHVVHPQTTNLNPIIQDLERMLRRLIGEDVELSTDLQAELAEVKADRGQLEQVIMNLVINARDAMPHGGRVIIETRNESISKGSPALPPEIPAGRYVTFSVTDTGIGMDKEVQSHLFEPFYTTKGVGKGTGLGLSTIYGIVRQSGGHISVASEPGKGSCFKIYLPTTTDAAETLAASHPAAGALTGSESILVVEDNEMVRRLTSGILERYGYRVRPLPSAEAALEVLARDEFPDVILTDMVLPGMSGLALCQCAAQQKCGIKRILMTGYTEEAMLHQGVTECGLPLLHKPFSPVELLTTVRGALDSGRPKLPSPTSRPEKSSLQVAR